MSKKINQQVFDQILDNFFKTYQDRGMKKWQGFFLSDHTATIKKDEVKRSTVYRKKKTMSVESVSKNLFKAYANHMQVAVQLKELDVEGNIQPDIVGFVQGYQANEILVSNIWLDLDNINHVDLGC